MNEFVLGLCLLLAGLNEAFAEDLPTQMKQGGYVIVLRHTATGDSQRMSVPSADDMKMQRQLSENGREAARAIGVSLKELRIPLGAIYTSKLNRAVETGSSSRTRTRLPGTN